jgi:hypothetical protein
LTPLFNLSISNRESLSFFATGKYFTNYLTIGLFEGVAHNIHVSQILTKLVDKGKDKRLPFPANLGLWANA